MRRVTHCIRQISSIRTYSQSFKDHRVLLLAPHPCFHASQFSVLGQPSIAIGEFHFTIDSRQNMPNGEITPLALPQGASLKVKNSLSKEKVSRVVVEHSLSLGNI